jgi:hypothetical protein
VLRDIMVALFGAGGAAVFSQAPEFFQQYLQRLGGALDELARLHLQVPSAQARLASLTAARDALQNASGFVRPYDFASHLQPEIALGTLAAFRPALPLTVEGFLYAIVGLFLGVALVNLVHRPARRLRHPA